MTLQAGARLGPYEIVAPLGAGGMGEVYRARDSRLGRDVALKVVTVSLSGDGDRLRRFEQEARAAAALNHPNIVALFDVGTDPAAPYLVTELLEGQTLRDVLDAGSLSPRRAVDYAVQIARGLAAAHERGIVHRDLKPENVFITADGRAKILDFGLAKLAAAEPSSGGTTVPTMPGTNPGVVLGTVGYMSPEQVRGQAADQRSDLFAFGAVLFEMLSGRRAFARETPAETMTAILKDDPPLQDGDRIPPGLARVITHCLEKQPALRFKSADDLAFALEALSSASGSTSTPAAIATGAMSVSVPRWRGALAFAAVALLSAAAAAGVMYALRPAPVRALDYQFGIAPPEGWRLTDFGPTFTPIQISPDGRAIVAGGVNAKGRVTLWVRMLDSVESRVLAGTEGVSVFFWSPDSRAVAFVARDKLSKIDLASGAVTPIADVPFVFSGAWSSTNDILLAAQGGFRKLRATGGELTQETTLAEGESLHTTPMFLPDGRHYTFVVVLGSEVRAGAQRALDIGTLGSSERVRLFAPDRFALPFFAADGRLVYMRQGRLMAQPFDDRRLTLSGEPLPLLDRVEMFDNRPYPLLSASAAGTIAYLPARTSVMHELIWYDREGTRISQVGDAADYGAIDLSRDGARIATSILEPGKKTRDIWLIDVARGVRTRFTFEPGDERTAVWWPDGSGVVFNAQRKATERDLYLRPASGSGEERPLVENGLSKDPYQVSQDGRLLLFRESGRNGNDLFVMSLSDGRRYPIAVTPANENYGQFSPDGRWIAYSSDETGQTEVFVVPVSGTGGRWQVSTVGGTMPRWRADGRELFYVGADGTLMATTVDQSAEGFQIGATAPLFNAALVRATGMFYAPSHDGQRFLANVEPSAAEGAIVVVSDWRSLLP